MKVSFAAIPTRPQHIAENILPTHSNPGTASTVEDAVEKMSAAKPDLIFLDIQLGNQSGFDLLKQLPVKDFEVIFVTAFDKYGIE